MSERKKITQKIKELEQHKHAMLYSNYSTADADVITQAVSDTEYEIMVLLERLEVEKNLVWFRATLYAAIAVILGAFIFVVATK